MAYWMCAHCGAENHDAYHRCTRCSQSPKSGTPSSSDSSDFLSPEVPRVQRRIAVASTWLLFLFFSSFCHRGDLLSLRLFTLPFFPIGLIALYGPKSDGDFTVWLISIWALYAVLTSIALSTTRKKDFNMALLVLGGVLALNMVGCHKMGF